MEDRKEIPVRSGESKRAIPAPSGSLSSILASGDPVGTLEARIPETHRTIMRQMGVRESDSGLRSSEPRVVRTVRMEEPQGISVGDELITNTGKRVVVLKCSVGKEEDGTPIHRVIRKKTGTILKISEKKLRR